MNTTVVLITLVAYKIALLLIGLWAQRRTHDATDFFLGGRSLGPVVAAVSYAASAASAWTLLGMSAVAYSLGVKSLWIALGAIAGCFVSWQWIAPRLQQFSHRHQALTLTDLLCHQVDALQRPRLLMTSATIILLSFSVYIASQFQGAGNTFASTFDLPSASSIGLGGSIILIYTLLGGFWAVSVTDTLQGLLMLGAAILVPSTALIACGGWEQMWLQLVQLEDAAYLSLTGSDGWLAAAGFIVASLAVGLGAFGQPHMLTRFMALGTGNALNQARLIAVSWYAIVFLGMWLLGLAGRVLIHPIDDPETLFFALAERLFHPVIGAILLAAVLSAIMSTADSMLLVSASVICHDLGFAKRWPGRELLLSRLTIAALCIAAMSIAIALPASIFERVLFAWLALGAAFGPLVFARLLHTKASANFALASMLTGFGLSVTLAQTSWPTLAVRLAPFACASLVLAWGQCRAARTLAVNRRA